MNIVEKDDFTDEERELFIADLKVVCGEYFDGDGSYSVDVTRTERGFSVCMLFDAARIKNFRRPH